MILCHKYVLFSFEPPCKPLQILVLYKPYFSGSAKYPTFELHGQFELLPPALHPILSITLLSFNSSCYLVTLFTSLYTFVRGSPDRLFQIEFAEYFSTYICAKFGKCEIVL